MIIESFGVIFKLLLLMQAFLCIFGISLLKEKNKCYFIELDKNQSYVKLDTHVYIVIGQNRRSQYLHVINVCIYSISMFLRFTEVKPTFFSINHKNFRMVKYF